MYSTIYIDKDDKEQQSDQNISMRRGVGNRRRARAGGDQRQDAVLVQPTLARRLGT